MQIDRYKHIVNRKSEGAHYTPQNLADFVAEQLVKVAKPNSVINIVDPAVGDGELLLSLLKALPVDAATINVYGFDTNNESINITKKRVKASFPNVSLHLLHQDFLEYCLLQKDGSGNNSLFIDSEIPDFDLLIANPPYIRTQVLGAKQSQLLSKTFGLKGRVDIYQAFLVAMKAVLKPEGVAGVIVSNRFLTTKGAATLRERLIGEYDLLKLWDFGDTKLFEAAVLPAVLLLSPNRNTPKTPTPFSSIYVSSQHSADVVLDSENLFDALGAEGKVRLGNDMTYKVRHGTLSYDTSPIGVWSLQDKFSEKWLESVRKNTWAHFKDVGKIRVGVKTTADKIFIRDDWTKEVGYEPELLRPITTHHVANRYCRLSKPLKHILYTHEAGDGKRQPVKIDKYPLSKKYLDQHYSKLVKRNYVIEAGRNWWEIWVPQNPSLWEKDKIIFKDISDKPTFWMDLDKTIVNGDCFWMVQDNPKAPKDILFLILAVANSSFIVDFYDMKFHNKLYSNRRRFITQYVENFPIPDPASATSNKLISIVKALIAKPNITASNDLEEELDLLVWKAFSVNPIDPMG